MTACQVTQLTLDLTVCYNAVHANRLYAGTDLWTTLAKVCPALQYLHIIVAPSNVGPELDETVLDLERKNGWWIEKLYASEINKWPLNSAQRVETGRVMVSLSLARLKGFCKYLALGFANATDLNWFLTVEDDQQYVSSD